MQYLRTMVRVRDLDQSLVFWRDALGLIEVSRLENTQGRFNLVFLAAPDDLDSAQQNKAPLVELTWNWDNAPLNGGRNFGHLAYRVSDIYAACQRLADHGVPINRPPRDGYMAFVRSPECISIELLQAGAAKSPEQPWASMTNQGDW
jgi:lactoylglutathione lyase